MELFGVTISWDQLFTNWLGFIAFVTGILSVALLIPTRMPRLQYLAWPAGVINAAGYFFLFLDWQLYGSTWLQPYFFVTSLLGTWMWRGQLFGQHTDFSGERGGLSRVVYKLMGVRELPTTFASTKAFLTGIVVSLGLAVPFYYILRHYQDAAPLWDALIFSISMVAIYFQLRKHVEAWAFWIGVDLISIPLYFNQGNGATGILYVLFIVMCFIGLRKWYLEAKNYVAVNTVTTAINYGILTPNEGRGMLGYASVEGGDTNTLLTPMGTIPLSEV